MRLEKTGYEHTVLRTLNIEMYTFPSVHVTIEVYFSIYIYAFSICFYPKRLTVDSGYTLYISV